MRLFWLYSNGTALKRGNGKRAIDAERENIVFLVVNRYIAPYNPVPI
jgi:hypothetical protein